MAGTPPLQQQKQQQQQGGGAYAALQSQRTGPAPLNVLSRAEEERVVARFACVKRSAVRNGYDQSASQRTGFVEVGELVEALECRTNESGVVRVRFRGGWVSCTSQKGDTLLKPVSPSPPDIGSNAAGTPEPPASDASTFVGCQMVSLSKAKIRAGSAMDSPAVGELRKDEELTVLELVWIDSIKGSTRGKLLRVRHARGENTGCRSHHQHSVRNIICRSTDHSCAVAEHRLVQRSDCWIWSSAPRTQATNYDWCECFKQF